MDPFAPPVQDGPLLQTGSVDLGVALSEGFSALLRNIGPLVAAGAMLFVAYIVSICTCVGWIVLLPLMMWGMYRFNLTMIDGTGRLGVLTSGTERLWPVVGRMWLLMLLFLLVSFPVVGVVGGFVGLETYQTLNGEQPNPLLSQIAITAVSGLWGLLLIRLQAAPYLVVERDLAPVDAFSSAWSATAPHWGKLMALQLLALLFAAPASVMQIGSQYLTAGAQEDPGQMVELMPITLALNGGAILWSLIVGPFFLLANASVYRQLFGPAPRAA